MSEPINAVAVIDQTPNMLALIDRAARDPSIDIGKMERLLAMAKEMRAETAKSDYDAAMSRAQSEMRPISRDCANPQTRSRYASQAAIDEAIRPIYTNEGFAMSFGAKASPVADHVICTCRVSHRAGHAEYLELDMPADGKGARGNDVMTKTHATGSALSYAKRYLTALVWNLSFGENDDDGNAASTRQAKPRQHSNYAGAPERSAQVNSEPKQATPVIRARMLENLKQFNREDLVSFMSSRSWNVVSPEEWPLENVPTTREALGELIREIEQFIERNAPKEQGEFTEPFWDQVITLPRKGQKKVDYMREPDTIKSLYVAAKSGDDGARMRLFGVVDHFEPKEWEGNDGKMHNPSVEDVNCRAALDLFQEWHDAKEKSDVPTP